MIATHATKAAVRYRYYVSQPSVHGEARTARLGSVSRVPAGEIEQAVVAAIKQRLRHQKSPTDSPQPIEFDRKFSAPWSCELRCRKTDWSSR
jgi:site-specific DNA recombinase